MILKTYIKKKSQKVEFSKNMNIEDMLLVKHDFKSKIKMVSPTQDQTK